MKKLVPNADTILAFLLGKKWSIETVKKIPNVGFSYWLKPPTMLGITDNNFGYSVNIFENEVPADWDHLSVIVMGISSLYNLKNEDALQLFFKPLDKVFEYTFQTIIKSEEELLSAA